MLRNIFLIHMYMTVTIQRAAATHFLPDSESTNTIDLKVIFMYHLFWQKVHRHSCISMEYRAENAFVINTNMANNIAEVHYEQDGL